MNSSLWTWKDDSPPNWRRSDPGAPDVAQSREKSMESAAPGSQGRLSVVSTPIGNLGDITLRALEVLRSADLVAAEDTRRARKLLSHYGISCRLEAYHAHNEHRKTAWILDRVQAGSRVALLTDAGTPAIADPGFLLVREALARQIEPEILPGPSALTFAVAICGFPVDRFAFYGFPPTKKGKRRTMLSQAAAEDMTVFFFEGPHRATKLLAEIQDVMGPRTRVAIIREATKVHEEVIRGPVSQLLDEHADRRWLGELVFAVDCRGIAGHRADAAKSGVAGTTEKLHGNPAGARAVEFTEEDALPGAENEAPVADRDE